MEWLLYTTFSLISVVPMTNKFSVRAIQCTCTKQQNASKDLVNFLTYDKSSTPYPELGENNISLLNGPNFCIELSTETTYPKLRSQGSAIADKIELQMSRLF